MPLFTSEKHDPKDDLIAELRDERNYLRERVKDLERQLLAVSDRTAYRILHNEPAPGDKPVKPASDLFATRFTPLRPTFSVKDVGSEDFVPPTEFEQ